MCQYICCTETASQFVYIRCCHEHDCLFIVYSRCPYINDIYRHVPLAYFMQRKKQIYFEDSPKRHSYWPLRRFKHIAQSGLCVKQAIQKMNEKNICFCSVGNCNVL